MSSVRPSGAGSPPQSSTLPPRPVRVLTAATHTRRRSTSGLMEFRSVAAARAAAAPFRVGWYAVARSIILGISSRPTGHGCRARARFAISDSYWSSGGSFPLSPASSSVPRPAVVNGPTPRVLRRIVSTRRLPGTLRCNACPAPRTGVIGSDVAPRARCWRLCCPDRRSGWARPGVVRLRAGLDPVGEAVHRARPSSALETARPVVAVRRRGRIRTATLTVFHPRRRLIPRRCRDLRLLVLLAAGLYSPVNWTRLAARLVGSTRATSSVTSNATPASPRRSTWPHNATRSLRSRPRPVSCPM